MRPGCPAGRTRSCRLTRRLATARAVWAESPEHWGRVHMLKLLGGYLRRHHVGLLALFLAMSGTAYAATLPRNSVGTAQLKPNAVTSAKVKNGSLRLSDFAHGQLPPSLAGPKGAPGAAGPAGPGGAAGAPGAQGPPGLDGSAVAAAVVETVGPVVGFAGAANFGFVTVTRNATAGVGHYCVGLSPALAPFVGLLAINVSAIQSPDITGAPVAFQTEQDTATCPALQVGIVTEVVTAAAVTPSDDVWFALSAN